MSERCLLQSDLYIHSCFSFSIETRVFRDWNIVEKGSRPEPRDTNGGIDFLLNADCWLLVFAGRIIGAEPVSTKGTSAESSQGTWKNDRNLVGNVNRLSSDAKSAVTVPGNIVVS